LGGVVLLWTTLILFLIWKTSHTSCEWRGRRRGKNPAKERDKTAEKERKETAIDREKQHEPGGGEQERHKGSCRKCSGEREKNKGRYQNDGEEIVHEERRIQSEQEQRETWNEGWRDGKKAKQRVTVREEEGQRGRHGGALRDGERESHEDRERDWESGVVHCDVCGVCIEGFDHHCHILSNCIGNVRPVFV